MFTVAGNTMRKPDFKHGTHNQRQKGDDTEVLLAAGANPQLLLKRLVESGAVIRRFELVEPTLHDIFIEKVKETA